MDLPLGELPVEVAVVRVQVELYVGEDAVHVHMQWWTRHETLRNKLRLHAFRQRFDLQGTQEYLDHAEVKFSVVGICGE